MSQFHIKNSVTEVEIPIVARIVTACDVAESALARAQPLRLDQRHLFTKRAPKVGIVLLLCN